jgi:hypothetical protein
MNDGDRMDQDDNGVGGSGRSGSVIYSLTH